MRIWIVAALIAATGTVHAQTAKESFNEAVKLLRTGDKEGALEKLREVVAADPSNQEAFNIWKDTEADVWGWILREKGDISQIGQVLIDRAKLDRASLSRDESAIDALVAKALDNRNFGDRSRAAQREFAVPALVNELRGDGGNKQNLAILALQNIGAVAVPALMAALDSDDAAQRRNVAAALVQIGDDRAAPAFAKLLQDADAGVREAARRGLKGLGRSESSSAVDLYLKQAIGYLNGGVAYGEADDVVWTWENSKLAFIDVPNTIQPYEMAKLRAHEALALDPSNARASSLLATAYVTSAAAIEEGREGTEDVADRAPIMRNVALSLGRDVLRRALDDAMNGSFSGAQQVALVESLAQLETQQGLGNSPLLRALDSASPGVSTAAALAVSDVAGSGAVPKADRLVAILGDAVTVESLRRVKVIDSNPISMTAVNNAGSNTQGIAIEAASTGRRAVRDLLTEERYDVYVVAENLSDTLSDAVISQIRISAPDAKVLVLAETDGASDRFGDKVDGIIEGPLSADTLIEKAIELAEQSDGGRGDAMARKAGMALHTLGQKGVALSGALTRLVEQLDRNESIAVPAAEALGTGGSLEQVPALVAVVQNGSAEASVRAACALACGQIFSRAGTVPSDAFDGLLAVAGDAEADGSVRHAASVALGHGKTPGQINKLSSMMRSFAGTN